MLDAISRRNSRLRVWRAPAALSSRRSSRHGAWIAALDDEFGPPGDRGTDGNHDWDRHDARARSESCRRRGEVQ
jgi:hypothetical protein